MFLPHVYTNIFADSAIVFYLYLLAVWPALMAAKDAGCADPYLFGRKLRGDNFDFTQKADCKATAAELNRVMEAMFPAARHLWHTFHDYRHALYARYV